MCDPVLSLTVRPLSIGQLKALREISYELRQAMPGECVLITASKTIHSLTKRGLLEPYKQGYALTAAGAAMMQYVRIQDIAGGKA